MNNFQIKIKYQLSRYISAFVIYLSIYIVTMTGVSFLLIKTSVITTSQGSLFYRVWGVAIFIFIIQMVRFREEFNTLLILSTPRTDIIKLCYLLSTLFSLTGSFLIVSEKVLIDKLNGILGFGNIVDPFHFIAPYIETNILFQLLFFFMLCLNLSLLGHLLGSLFYRFGKFFTASFWIVLSALLLIIIPSVKFVNDQFTVWMYNTSQFFTTFSLGYATLVLGFLSAVFSVGIYINVRRLPQR